MEKVELTPKTFLYPLPATLVGANVNGKPNYITIAYCGIVGPKPPVISVAMNKVHYTNDGIKENGTFSVNIPSVQMVEVTDYCGIYSGHKVDKSVLFETFYGKLKTAPMIKECPLNLECKLIQIHDMENHDVFWGEIIAVYSEERYLTNGLPDVMKMEPIVYSHHDRNYWKIGEHVARAWYVGKNLKAK